MTFDRIQLSWTVSFFKKKYILHGIIFPFIYNMTVLSINTFFLTRFTKCWQLVVSAASLRVPLSAVPSPLVMPLLKSRTLLPFLISHPHSTPVQKAYEGVIKKVGSHDREMLRCLSNIVYCGSRFQSMANIIKKKGNKAGNGWYLGWPWVLFTNCEIYAKSSQKVNKISHSPVKKLSA